MKKNNTIFFSIILLFFVSNGFSQSWTALSTGTNDRVRTLLHDTINDRLIVGGDFTYAGGISTPFVASWDGTSWQNIGIGFNGPVYDLALFNNEIYACGSFTMSGTDTVKYLAKWNGINWEAVGNVNANNAIKYLNSNQGKLYISGDFTSYGSINKLNITWNGTAFDSIAGFQNYYPITDIAFYKFKTYFACGPQLVSSNGFSYQYLSAANGCVSFQSPIYIKSLQVNNDLLYLAGPNVDPDIFGDYYANTVGVYDGTTCQGYAVFNAHWATNGPVNRLKSFGDYLYMGGYFDKSDFGALNTGNIPTYNINRFNTTTETFSAVNYGTDEEIYDIEIYKGALYAGGRFIEAGNVTANFIAKLPCLSAPTVSLSSFADVCKNSEPIILTGGLPAGGAYSGSGVSGGVFTPSSAGTKNITYTYTDSTTGCSSSITKTIVVSVCTGIEELTNTPLTIVYPNPSSQEWNVLLNNTEADYQSLVLTDITGKTVWSYTMDDKQPSTIVIPNLNLNNGLYFLKTMSTQGAEIQKLIKK